MPFGVLPVDPPGEIKEQLLENPLEENNVPFPGPLFFEMICLQRGPRMDRRIDVTEVPFVCRYLAIRTHIPFTQKKYELLLCKVRIYLRERHAVKSEVP